MAFNIQFSGSLIVRKLASYPRQNRLALVIRELGRLECTLFILEWIKKSFIAWEGAGRT